MNAKDIISSGLLELYVAGLTSEEETLLVQQYTQDYPEVAAELNAIEQAVEGYAQANAIVPANTVKEKILAQINENAPDEMGKIIPLHDSGNAVVSMSSRWKYAAAAAILLLIGSSLFNVYQYTKTENITKELQETKSAIASLESQNKEMDQYIEAVRNRYSVAVSLTGTNAETTDASAKVYWTKNTGDVYIDASSLAAAPKGKQYELWAIIDGKPVNAGIIMTTASGKEYKIQKMKSFGSVQAFAISLEKENPTPAETPTEVYIVGAL